jgi:hypothetical protein
MQTKMSNRAFLVLVRTGMDVNKAISLLHVVKKKQPDLEEASNPEEVKKSVRDNRFSSQRNHMLDPSDDGMVLHPLTKQWVSKTVLADKRIRMLQ